jgi:glucose-6-phosphate isomerase
MALRIDDARMMAQLIPSGVSPTEWNELSIRFGEIHAATAAAAKAGRYGFDQLDAQAAEFARVQAFAKESARAFDDVVVLGIGGSALGVIALRTALGEPGMSPRLHVLDNVDPRSIAQLLVALKPERTLWCVISKSGTTVETLAQYALARAWVERAKLPVAKHFAFVTDPAAGPLRAIANRDSIPAFEVPSNVGGRFSVFTPVGTLPALLAGYDAPAFLSGARSMLERCGSGDLSSNPSGLFAALMWRAHQKAGQGTHVLMPYSDGLRDLAPWFVQLWGESLGKKDSDGLPGGPTPLGARGATDQHSLLQLLMEGPADKVVAFVRLATHREDLRLAGAGLLPEAAAFMNDRTLGELLDAEADATARALVSAGRPSFTITLDTCDARGIGEAMMLFMQATIYAGALYRVDPLGQPGVELGKRLAKEALSRPAQ